MSAPEAPGQERDQEKVTTFTPMMWALLSDDERYAEYVRVREALSASRPSSRNLVAEVREIVKRDLRDSECVTAIENWCDSFLSASRPSVPESGKQPLKLIDALLSVPLEVYVMRDGKRHDVAISERWVDHFGPRLQIELEADPIPSSLSSPTEPNTKESSSSPLIAEAEKLLANIRAALTWTPPPGPPDPPKPRQCPHGHSLTWISPRFAICDGTDLLLLWELVPANGLGRSSSVKAITEPAALHLAHRVRDARALLTVLGSHTAKAEQP